MTLAFWSEWFNLKIFINYAQIYIEQIISKEQTADLHILDFATALLVWSNSNQSNRRPDVQWCFFPIHSKSVFSGTNHAETTTYLPLGIEGLHCCKHQSKCFAATASDSSWFIANAKIFSQMKHCNDLINSSLERHHHRGGGQMEPFCVSFRWNKFDSIHWLHLVYLDAL